MKAKTAKVRETVAEDASPEGESRKAVTRPEIPDTIVSAAATLFRHQGFAATSMQEIAVAAGLTRPTLYYYFRNKEEILGNLVEEITMKSLRQAFQRGAEESTSPDEQLRTSVRAYAMWILQHLEGFAVLSRNEHELPEAQRTLQRQGRRDLLEALRTLVENGISSGHFRVVDPTISALSIFGMCNWTIEWFREDGRLTKEQTADSIAELALNMLGRPASGDVTAQTSAKSWFAVLKDDLAHLEKAVAALEQKQD